jgi:hypothetical protein
MNGQDEYYMTLIKELEGISSILTGKDEREFVNSNDFLKQYKYEKKQLKNNISTNNEFKKKISIPSKKEKHKNFLESQTESKKEKEKVENLKIYMSLIKELEGISSILTGKDEREFVNAEDFSNSIYKQKLKHRAVLTSIKRSYNLIKEKQQYDEYIIELKKLLNVKNDNQILTKLKELKSNYNTIFDKITNLRTKRILNYDINIDPDNIKYEVLKRFKTENKEEKKNINKFVKDKKIKDITEILETLKYFDPVLIKLAKENIKDEKEKIEENGSFLSEKEDKKINKIFYKSEKTNEESGLTKEDIENDIKKNIKNNFEKNYTDEIAKNFEIIENIRNFVKSYHIMKTMEKIIDKENDTNIQLNKNKQQNINLAKNILDAKKDLKDKKNTYNKYRDELMANTQKEENELKEAKKNYQNLVNELSEQEQQQISLINMYNNNNFDIKDIEKLGVILESKKNKHDTKMENFKTRFSTLVKQKYSEIHEEWKRLDPQRGGGRRISFKTDDQINQIGNSVADSIDKQRNKIRINLENLPLKYKKSEENKVQKMYKFRFKNVLISNYPILEYRKPTGDLQSIITQYININNQYKTDEKFINILHDFSKLQTEGEKYDVDPRDYKFKPPGFFKKERNISENTKKLGNQETAEKAEGKLEKYDEQYKNELVEITEFQLKCLNMLIQITLENWDLDKILNTGPPHKPLPPIPQQNGGSQEKTYEGETKNEIIKNCKKMITNCQNIINKYKLSEGKKKEILLEACIRILETKIKSENINIEIRNIEDTIKKINEIYINNEIYNNKLIGIITINTNKLIDIKNKIETGIENNKYFMNIFKTEYNHYNDRIEIYKKFEENFSNIQEIKDYFSVPQNQGIEINYNDILKKHYEDYFIDNFNLINMSKNDLLKKINYELELYKEFNAFNTTVILMGLIEESKIPHDDINNIRKEIYDQKHIKTIVDFIYNGIPLSDQIKTDTYKNYINIHDTSKGYNKDVLIEYLLQDIEIIKYYYNFYNSEFHNQQSGGVNEGEEEGEGGVLGLIPEQQPAQQPQSQPAQQPQPQPAHQPLSSNVLVENMGGQTIHKMWVISKIDEYKTGIIENAYGENIGVNELRNFRNKFIEVLNNIGYRITASPNEENIANLYNNIYLLNIFTIYKYLYLNLHSDKNTVQEFFNSISNIDIDKLGKIMTFLRQNISEYNNLTIMSLIEKVINDESKIKNDKVFNIGTFDNFKKNFIDHLSLKNLMITNLSLTTTENLRKNKEEYLKLIIILNSPHFGIDYILNDGLNLQSVISNINFVIQQIPQIIRSLNTQNIVKALDYLNDQAKNDDDKTIKTVIEKILPQVGVV